MAATELTVRSGCSMLLASQWESPSPCLPEKCHGLRRPKRFRESQRSRCTLARLPIEPQENTREDKFSHARPLGTSRDLEAYQARERTRIRDDRSRASDSEILDPKNETDERASERTSSDSVSRKQAESGSHDLVILPIARGAIGRAVCRLCSCFTSSGEGRLGEQFRTERCTSAHH